MNYRPFGRTGLKIAPLALGTDNFANPTPREACFAILDAAVEAGINLIDTSNSYVKGEAERIIGAWLADRGKRDQVLIATKVFYPTGPGPNDRGLSRAHIVRACEDSLRRLGVDAIDLYQTHRPDFDTPLDETLQGALRRQHDRAGLASGRVADDEPATRVRLHRERAVTLQPA